MRTKGGGGEKAGIRSVKASDRGHHVLSSFNFAAVFL